MMRVMSIAVTTASSPFFSTALNFQVAIMLQLLCGYVLEGDIDHGFDYWWRWLYRRRNS
jgi:hypothetical protein